MIFIFLIISYQALWSWNPEINDINYTNEICPELKKMAKSGYKLTRLLQNKTPENESNLLQGVFKFLFESQRKLRYDNPFDNQAKLVKTYLLGNF